MKLPEVPSALEVLAKRRQYLETLVSRGPLHKPDLEEALGDSRSTVDRAIGELEDAALVERIPRGYVSTQSGRLALARYESFLADANAILDAQSVVEAIPREYEPPAEVATNARVESVGGEYELFSWVAQAIRAVDDCRIVVPHLGDSRHVRLWHDVAVDGDTEIELLASQTVLEQLGTEFPKLGADLAGADSFTATAVETPPFGLVLASGAVGLSIPHEQSVAGDGLAETEDPPGTETDTETALVLAFEDGATGMLASTDERVLAWGQDLYEQLRSAGSSADETLTEGQAAGLSAVSPRFPTRLEKEGFLRVDEAYFAEREPLSPAAAWRAGLGLPEVAAGYAVSRTTDDGRSYATTIVDRLTEGENVALIGPPGTGKSTLCRQVARRWADRGTVFYRQSEGAEAFTSVPALSRAIDRADPPVLVVVEDIVRPGASSVLELVEQTTGRDDVVFLADARDEEWHAPDAEPDVRRDAVRQDAFSVLTMPRLDEDDARRFVDRTESLLAVDIDVDPSALLEEVRAAGPEDPAPGGVLLFIDRLARFGDPTIEAGNALDADVDAVRADLIDEGETALAAGILANALNAAGIELYDELLYALAVAEPAEESPGDRIAQVEAALDRLRGHVLFSRPDDRGYHGVHESWSVQFLRRVVETTDEHTARRRFGTAISALLALADEPTRRDRIAALRAGTTPALEQIAVDPSGWADSVTEALFDLGVTTPALTPLYGTTDTSALSLPAAISPPAEGRCLRARGRMHTLAGAYDRAAGEFERLLDHAETVGCQALAAEAIAQLGRVERERGNFERAVERFERAIERARDVDDARTEAMGLDGLGTVAHRRGAYDRATEYHERALAIHREIGNRHGEVVAVRRLAAATHMRGEYDQARQQYERALEISREIGDRREEGQALVNLGIVAHQRGEYDRARNRYEAAIAIQREIGDRRGEAKSLYSLGVIATNQAELDRARERYEAALRIRREVGDQQGVARTLNALATLETRSGQYDQARDRAEHALAIFEELADTQGQASALATLGTVAYRRGAYDRSREYNATRLSLVRETEDRRGELMAVYSLGRIALEQGELTEARERLESALEIARELEVNQEITCLRTLAALARTEGEYDTAAERLASARDRLEQFDDPSRRAKLALERARLALARGEPAVARDALDTAADTFGEDDTPYWYGLSRRLEGTVELAGDDDRDAATLDRALGAWTDALEIFERIDAPGPALSTLQRIVETTREAGRTDRSRAFHERARALLETAPAEVAARHREWIDATAVVDS